MYFMSFSPFDFRTGSCVFMGESEQKAHSRHRRRRFREKISWLGVFACGRPTQPTEIRSRRNPVVRKGGQVVEDGSWFDVIQKSSPCFSDRISASFLEIAQLCNHLPLKLRN